MNQNYIVHQTSDSCDISDNSDSNYLLTANSPIIHGRQLKVGWLQNPKKLFLFLFYAKKVIKMQKKKKFCYCISILVIRPLTRSLHNLRKRVF